jgi:hypothetical protein
MAEQLILRLRIDIIAGDGFGYQTDQLKLVDVVKICFWTKSYVCSD